MTPQDLKVYTIQEIDGWRETATETKYVKAEDVGKAILAAMLVQSFACAHVTSHQPLAFREAADWMKKATELSGCKLPEKEKQP